MTQLAPLTYYLRHLMNTIFRQCKNSSWLLVLFLLLSTGAVYGQACIPFNFTSRTTAEGLGDDVVLGVFVDGDTIYAATANGLSISTDGLSFRNQTTAHGLGSNYVMAVYARGKTVYAATDQGLAISTDGGYRFTNRTVANGLGSDYVVNVFVADGVIYAATDAGLSISTNGGATFLNKDSFDGLGSDVVWGVYASGKIIYAATEGGLSISMDSGVTFITLTSLDGLGDDLVYGVTVLGNKLFVATASGLSISTDGGITFTTKTTANGLGGDFVTSVLVRGSMVYAITDGGLSISSDGGESFVNKTAPDDFYDAALGFDAISSHCAQDCQRPGSPTTILGVYAIGNVVYVATDAGLFIGNCIKAAPSEQKTGAVLVFPYYVSNAAKRTNTRFTLSNTSTQAVFAHLFFIDGVSGNPTDQFLCLTPNASLSFTMSTIDPETTGWLLVVTVDADGHPLANNGLLGNAFVSDDKYQGNYNAISFRANSSALARMNANGTATLLFDGDGYDAVPRQFVVSIQSPLDAPGQKIVLVGMSGDLTQSRLRGVSQIGPGLIYNGTQDPDDPAFDCFCTFLTGSSQLVATISKTSPRISGGVDALIPKGQEGTLKFNVEAAVGLLLTPRNATWHGIRALPATALTLTKIIIPVFRPVC